MYLVLYWSFGSWGVDDGLAGLACTLWGVETELGIMYIVLYWSLRSNSSSILQCLRMSRHSLRVDHGLACVACDLWGTKPDLCCCCRWGNAKSPAYGTLNDYQFMRRHTNSSKRQEKAKQCWGASLSKIDDVNKVFVKYAQGTPAPAPFEQPGPALLLPKESSLRAFADIAFGIYVRKLLSARHDSVQLTHFFLYVLWVSDRSLSTIFRPTSGGSKAARYIILITRAWVLILDVGAACFTLLVILCRGSWNVALE